MISEKEEKLLDLINRYWAENYFSPSVRDLKASTGWSTSTISATIQRLVFLGHLSYTEGTARSFVPTWVMMAIESYDGRK